MTMLVQVQGGLFEPFDPSIALGPTPPSPRRKSLVAAASGVVERAERRATHGRRFFGRFCRIWDSIGFP